MSHYYLLRKKVALNLFIWGIGSTKDQKILISELDENEYIIKVDKATIGICQIKTPNI